MEDDQGVLFRKLLCVQCQLKVPQYVCYDNLLFIQGKLLPNAIPGSMKLTMISMTLVPVPRPWTGREGNEGVG